jgi:predicted O-methyltransferase YrrM
MTAEELYTQGLAGIKDLSLQSIKICLRAANEGAIDDVLNINGNAYYQFLPCLIELVKPQQIVELGGAMGVADIMMLTAKYQGFDLYSITLPEHSLEFSYVVDKYLNFYPIVGDDLDLKNWPSNLKLNETDIWFFDTTHTYDLLHKELELYKPFIKKGAIVLFDDIHLNEDMEKGWKEIKSFGWDCADCTDPLHYSGFAICKV